MASDHSVEGDSSAAETGDGGSGPAGVEPTATLPVAAGEQLPGSGADVTAELQLPGYVLTAQLGSGAYGQVWQAVRVGAGQDVAVKIFTSPGRLDWRYLQREVDRLLRVAEHPHVVTLLDANLQHHPPFYAMVLLRSGSLADLIRDARPYLNVNQALEWFEQIVKALEFAHGKGLLHCDLKPANVLMDEEGNVRLADFGQSQLRGEAANVLGTLNYMAPEQAVVASEDRAPPDPSVSWDIYGLGATMYALLSGRAPHTHADLQATLTSIQDVGGRLEQYREYVLSTPIRPLRQLNPGVSKDLAQIISHCLQPQAARRYRNVSELADDLRRLRQQLPLRCHKQTELYRFRKFLRRNLGMVTIAIAAILALATVTATLTIQYRAERTRLESDIDELRLRLQVAQDRIEVLQGQKPAVPVETP